MGVTYSLKRGSFTTINTQQQKVASFIGVNNKLFIYALIYMKFNLLLI